MIEKIKDKDEKKRKRWNDWMWRKMLTNLAFKN